MGTDNYELFTIPNAGPTGAPAYGTASFAALPTSSFNFDRGFDIGLGIDLSAKVGVELRDVLYAALGGGLSGSLGLQATVGFPLDLFTSPGGGFAMRFRGQAEAAGYLRADVGLDTATFAGLLREGAPGPLTDLVSTFVEHVLITAGVWAHAGIAAQVDAQTYCTGRIWPPSEAGFSVVVKYAAGWYWGYGLSYVTNLKITDPAGMLDRLATQISGLALDAAQEWVDTLTPGGTEERSASAALPYVQLLAPAFTRCLFSIGVQLADSSATDAHREASIDAVVASFLAEARKLVLNIVIDAALQAAQDAFDPLHIVDHLAHLTMDQKAEVLGAIEALRGDVWALTRPGMSAGDILDGVTDLLEPLQTLLGLGVFGDATDDLSEALGLMWAGAAIARHVAGWVDEPGTAVTDLQHDVTLLPPLPGGPVAAWLAAKVPGKSAGTGFKISEVVTILVNTSPLGQAQLPPDLDALLIWIREVLGIAPGDLLALLLRGQLQDGAEAATQIVERLAEKGTGVIRDQVIPQLLAKAAAVADPGIQVLLNEVLIPALLGTPAEILPALASLGTTEDAKRVREAASALLIQTFIDLVIRSTDITLDRALTAAPPWLNQAADSIRDLGEEYPAYSVLASTAAVAATGVDLLPADAAELLRLSARAMTLWNDHQRDAAMRLLREVMRLRLGDPGTRDATLEAYLTSNNAPNPAAMGAAMAELADGMWLLIRELMPKALLLLPHHFEHQVAAWAAAAEQAFTQGIAEAKKFIDNFPNLAEEWRQKLDQLARDIADAAAHLADLFLALPSQLADLQDQFLDRVQGEAGRTIDAVTAGYPEPISALARVAFEAAFVPLRWQLEAPMALLAETAELLRDTTAGLAPDAPVDPASLRAKYRARILSRGMGTIRVPLVVDAGPLGRVDLGSVVLSDAWFRSAVADLMLGHPAVSSTIDQASLGLARQRAMQAAQAAAERSQAEALTKDQAAKRLTDATTAGPPPRITVMDPINGVSRPDKIAVRLFVRGADRMFVDPPFGAPQRVLVRLNGQRIATNPGWWTDHGIAQALNLTVLPSPAKAFPVLAFSQGGFNVEGQPGAPGTLHTFEAHTWREPAAVGRPGMNTLEVVAVDGAGHRATAVRHFYFGPRATSTVLMPQIYSAPNQAVIAYGMDGTNTPIALREYEGVGAQTTRAVSIAIGPGQQQGVVLVGEADVTVLNAVTGEHLRRPSDPSDPLGPLLTALATSGLVKDPQRCDVVAVSPDDNELRIYTANDEEGVLLDAPPMQGVFGTVAVTTVRPAGYPVDLVALLKPDRVELVRVDGSDVLVVSSFPLQNMSWTGIVAGRFTASGAPCVLIYAASTGTWQILELLQGTTLTPADGGRPGGPVGPLPIGVTDLLPGQFGGEGHTDLFLWEGGSVQGSVVTTAGIDGFKVLVPHWTDWQMSMYACPVSVPGTVPRAVPPAPPSPDGVVAPDPDPDRPVRRTTRA